ncbi:MAG: hypothetical protein HQ518_22560 [Rhodopirellula sp.]|nr:hypothetical protein [Rhodopirellula sp.]
MNDHRQHNQASWDAIDPELLRKVAKRLAEARANPPTIMSTLLKWPGTPFLLLFGVLGTTILMVLANLPDSAISPVWIALFVGIVLGACLRDLGFARRIARLWIPQTHFIDWQKVDEHSV